MAYTIKVFKKDRRSKTGERLVFEEKYPEYFSGNAMMDEVYDLKRSKYKEKDGYRIEW